VSAPGTDLAIVMTAAERGAMCVILRRREKLQKTFAAARAAELRAEAERQLQAVFHYDDDATWAKAHAIADATVSEAQSAVAARCAELGIPREFAPSLSMYWSGRGINGVKTIRDELRRLADARIESMEREAVVKIETRSVELQEQIMRGGFSTDAAAQFLDALPAPESLMQPVDVRQIMLTQQKPRLRGM
jgi:NAD(P)-dependent dehydrogenase (short-subunit alcohol dehydrogenase family)